MLFSDWYKIRLNEITFAGFRGAISPISSPLDPPLLLLHIYWVTCAIAWLARFKSWLWARTCTSYDTYSNSLLHSQRSTGLFVCKIADTFLSYFILLAKACSTYRIGRLCSMPPPRNKPAKNFTGALYQFSTVRK